jgi:hypothetical protein
MAEQLEPHPEAARIVTLQALISAIAAEANAPKVWHPWGPVALQLEHAERELREAARNLGVPVA